METKNTDVRACDGLRWLPYYDTPVPVAKITFFIHKISHIAQFLLTAQLQLGSQLAGI